MKIPKIIQEEAEKLGFNSVGFVGEADGSLVFGCSNIGDDGLAIPEGLPTLILLKSDKTKIVSGEDGFDLAGRFQ